MGTNGRAGGAGYGIGVKVLFSVGRNFGFCLALAAVRRPGLARWPLRLAPEDRTTLRACALLARFFIHLRSDPGRPAAGAQRHLTF